MYENLCIFSFRMEVGSSDFCCMAHFLPLGIRSLPSVTALSLLPQMEMELSFRVLIVHVIGLLCLFRLCSPATSMAKKNRGHCKPGVSKHCPGEFCYNQLQKPHLEDCSLPGETLISWFRCVFIGVGAKLYRTTALQDRVWTPLL